jgi:hypothetical protein
MKREEKIKLQILREACDVKEGTGLAWHKDRCANEIAMELIDERLVVGSVSEYGTACITGIRDAGRDFLNGQNLHKKALAALRRVLFVFYSLALLAIGYIMNLDSVKTFFSDLIGKFLK